MVRLLLVAVFVAAAWAAPRPGGSSTLDEGRLEEFNYQQWAPYDWERHKNFRGEDVLEEGSGVSPVTTGDPCTTTAKPCPTTTARPCPTTTAAPCPTPEATTANPCTTTTAVTPCPTTTEATTLRPCTTTTEATTLPPCTTTTEAPTAPPCTTEAPIPGPCFTTTTTEATTTAVAGPCSTTTVPSIIICPGTTDISVGPFGPWIEATTGAAPIKYCRDGWTRFRDSCYYFERDNKKSLKEAEKHCRSLNATLFVADSLDEYKDVINKAPMNTFTWLGLHKPKEQEEPHWHVNSTVDYKELNWLVKPYGDHISNGWTTASQCAAHWNPSFDAGKYVFWYPCNYAFHYICELNSTPKTDIHTLF